MDIDKSDDNFQRKTFSSQDGPLRAFRVSVSAKDVKLLRAGGGAENGQFVLIENDDLKDYSIRQGDVLVEIEKETVAGYTRADVQTLFDYCSNQNQAVNLQVVQRDVLNRDLRAFLCATYTKGSFEQILQGTIRDNLYIRTVPCTTRTPRTGEVNGVDYHFLSKEDFAYLEQGGQLLESGVFEGNFYGTPLPNIQIQGRDSTSRTPLLVPGAHPSSEGKRRRNRSNVEAFLNPSKSAMAPSTSGGHLDVVTGHDKINNNNNNNSGSSSTGDNGSHPNETNVQHHHHDDNLNITNSFEKRETKPNDVFQANELDSTTIVDDELGPLPPHWEKAYTEHGEPYFIDLNTNTSQWDDPRLCGPADSIDESSAGLQNPSVGSPLDQMEHLPYGWERIDDPQYGTYYIDHINKRTQYESPVIGQNNEIISGNTVLNTSGSIMSVALSFARDDDKSTAESPHLHDTETNTPFLTAQQHNRAAQYAVVWKDGKQMQTDQYHNSDTLPKDRESFIDPLYATINHHKKQAPTSNGLQTTHNYANVYEPQYRMSEGHRHRENGMVSCGHAPDDDADKINESQATENDSVFTNGGNQDLDNSLHSDTEIDAKEENNNNNHKTDNNHTNTSNNINNNVNSKNQDVKKNREASTAKLIQLNNNNNNKKDDKDSQMNGSRDGILAFVPCLASCVQDKTYASIEEFKKNFDEKGALKTLENDGSTNDRLPQDNNSSSASQINATNVEQSRKVPPPTLPKPVLSQINHQQPSQVHHHHHHHLHHQGQPQPHGILPPQYQLPYVFTRNPAELEGEIVHVSLVKSPRGFGFTIIGGNDHQAEEFLQIRSITPGGPAWNDGKLQTGDVLVHVNGICVLGYTHSDVVSLFQSIAPGEMVHLQICRGYKLPFDPDDPNMEIVTTQAVTANLSLEQESNDSMINRSVVGASQEYHDIYGTVMRKMQNIDLSKGSLGGSATTGAALSSSNVEQHNSFHEESILDFDPPKFLTVEIVKGTTGFGFTIADSANGQKVKKILDEARCLDLAEGDILVDINGRDVRSRLHSEVVQALKECQIGSTARITVQRGGFTTSRSKATGARSPVPGDDAGSERGSHASTSFSQFNFNPNPSPMQYRSKTPTADLYSSAKEVVVQRPKTPVVDTRNWECPEKPPRTGPQLPPNMTVPDANINNSIYGTTSMPPNANDIYGPRFEDDLYGHIRSKSEVWHYDYPTPAGQRNLSRNAHSAVASSQGDYANYYALYGNDRMTPQPAFDHQQNVYGTTGYAESLAPSIQNFDYGAEFQVTLSRQESGFGFRIVGGTEEGSQVAIGHIVPGGAADLDGQIITGDEILSVDGHSVTNASHHHVVQLMGAAALSGQVTLGLRRRISSLHNTSGQSSEMVPGYTYNVVVERHESEGFGFVIISSVGKCGSTIGRIIEGSPAERCGKLQLGDRIHAVNGISILDMHHEDIVNLIKVSGLTVTLTIAPRTGAISAIQDDLSSIGTNRPLGPDDFSDRPGSQMLTASSLVEGQMLPPASPGGPPEFRRVVLQRGVRGFGFSIRGGREFHNMPLFVLRIAEMGPAQMSGQLHVGDQILEVNGICTDNMTHAEAISLIRQGGNTVTLLIKRTNQQNHPPLSGNEFESTSSLLSQHSLGGPISQSSPRSPSAMMLHSSHHHQQAQQQQQQQQQHHDHHQHAIYGTHGAHDHWIG